jgi:hypothetical protein
MGAGRLALFKIEFALRLVSWHSVRPAGPLASGSLVIRVFSFDLGLVASQIPGQALSAPASGPGPGPVLAAAQAACGRCRDLAIGAGGAAPARPGNPAARPGTLAFTRRRRSSPSGWIRMRLCGADGRPTEGAQGPG